MCLNSELLFHVSLSLRLLKVLAVVEVEAAAVATVATGTMPTLDHMAEMAVVTDTCARTTMMVAPRWLRGVDAAATRYLMIFVHALKRLQWRFE